MTLLWAAAGELAAEIRNSCAYCFLLELYFGKKQSNTSCHRLFREEQDEGPKLLGTVLRNKRNNLGGCQNCHWLDRWNQESDVLKNVLFAVVWTQRGRGPSSPLGIRILVLVEGWLQFEGFLSGVFFCSFGCLQVNHYFIVILADWELEKQQK